MSTLQALHDLLLDRSKWPDDFVWNYESCDSCAIGLAWRAELIDVYRSITCSWLSLRHRSRD